MHELRIKLEIFREIDEEGRRPTLKTMKEKEMKRWRKTFYASGKWLGR
jgi:hypothetical protein